MENIIDATDGGDLVEGCVLGLAECSEENPCPLHDSWKEVRTKLTEMLESRTLADLAEVAQRRSKARKK